MAKWNASVGLQLTIDYDDIEADTKAEAICMIIEYFKKWAKIIKNK